MVQVYLLVHATCKWTGWGLWPLLAISKGSSFPFERWGNTLYTNMKKNNLFMKKNACAHSLVPVRPFNITENKDDDLGMWKEDINVKFEQKLDWLSRLGPQNITHWGCLQMERASQSSIYITQPGAPRCGALMNVPPHSYCPVHWFIRSLLASHEKGEVMLNIEVLELLVK